MKAHIGVDADSGLVHTVRGTAGHVNGVVEANSLLHGQETDVFADAGYQGAHKRPDAKSDMQWHVAMRPGLRKLLDKADPMDTLTEQVERIKASIRAKVEYPFRVIKRQFGHVKVRYRGLAKNTAQLQTLFALANLWMVRKRETGGRHECGCCMGNGRETRPKHPLEERAAVIAVMSVPPTMVSAHLCRPSLGVRIE
jgi:IS5 family transposase